MSIQFNYPNESVLIPLTDIDYEERGRVEMGNIQSLADSIVEHGLIHPPTLTMQGNKLIAGGRRLAAMQLLGCTEIPVVFRENMPAHLVAELELTENLARLDMNWQEKVLLLHKMHRLKVLENIKMNKNWKQKETGAMLGVSAGHVSHCLIIADLLLKDDKEVATAETLAKAWNVILERKEREAMKVIAERSGAIPNMSDAPKRDESDIIVVDLVDNFTEVREGSSEVLGATADVAKEAVPQSEAYSVKLDDMFMHGDCLEIMSKLPENYVDHIVTDIPYGIDMQLLDQNKEVKSVEATHGVQDNLDMMPKFLKLAHRVVKEGGYVVFWYDLDHHEKLQNWAKKAGFSLQKWPLIWVKTHMCRNSMANKNFTKSTEYAMVLRKGTANLHKPSIRNYVIADGMPERKLYNNPFSKPFEVWKFILEHIAFKGQSILDPYAGQMSCPRAVINLGMLPRAIEIDGYHFYNGINMVKELYKEMTSGNITFTGDPTAGMNFDNAQVSTYVDPDEENGELPY